jgi:tRNA 2-selenouridine synthase
MERAFNKLEPGDFLEYSVRIPMLDVRAPKEFCQGHIPGAVNLPLFTDEERAVIGKRYSQVGKDEALLKGLEIVGPKMTDFVKTARKISPENEVLVHCWRGGMRSEAMAWLLDFAGIKTSVLAGGYKAYRHYIRQAFVQGPTMVVLAGMTGCGKTDILHQLEALGEQIIDLESIAHHKGSAFGSLGQPDQPTNEQFENDLAAKWLLLDHGKNVWIEDESRNIGKVIIPEPIFNRMNDARVVYIDVPFEERVNRLVKEYGDFDHTLLSSIIEKINRRIGGDVANTALASLRDGDVRNAITIVLKYYDKTYQYGLSKKDETRILSISSSEFRRGFAELRRKLKI